MRLPILLWTLISFTILKLGVEIFGSYFLIHYDIEPIKLGLIGGTISFMFWLTLIGTIFYIILKNKKFKRKQLLLLSLLLILIAVIVQVNKTWINDLLYQEYYHEKPNKEDPSDLTMNDVAEIQVIDLIHLVGTGNKKVFSELIAYSGSDENRYLKNHLNFNHKIDKTTNELYFSELKKIITYCYDLKPSTGDIDTEYTFVITDSRIIEKENIQRIRVKMNFCLPNEVECIDEVYYFDFVIVENECLLIDINELELYNKKTATNIV